MTANRARRDRSFHGMAMRFRVRDLRHPPTGILRAAGVRDRMTVLDFGCGPGGFSIAAARLVGPEGRVYALDRNPQALEYVRRAAARRRLRNVRPIEPACINEIAAASVDVVLLYDVLHHIEEPGAVLRQIQGVLGYRGLLSVSDHHMEPDSIISAITCNGLFELRARNRRTCEFAPTSAGDTHRPLQREGKQK